ncbi:MAG: hypothetical protein HY705_01265 [Gemmatimonadetes bacterium]|nr:hypothetical protein [Gemmatimonadota bacterium]
MSLQGRHWVALWLAGFLAVAGAVVARQDAALAAARELRALEAARAALEVSKATAAGEIRRARSRAVLVPLAERRLGLRLPRDSEIVILQGPRPR